VSLLLSKGFFKTSPLLALTCLITGLSSCSHVEELGARARDAGAGLVEGSQDLLSFDGEDVPIVSEPQAPPPVITVSHTAKPSDTLWTLARKYNPGMTDPVLVNEVVDQIKIMNALQSDLLLSGQVLEVPVVSDDAAAKVNAYSAGTSVPDESEAIRLLAEKYNVPASRVEAILLSEGARINDPLSSAPGDLSEVPAAAADSQAVLEAQVHAAERKLQEETHQSFIRRVLSSAKLD